MSPSAPSESAAPRVVAVVVTWNREELLREAVAALGSQSHEPERIVIVDNASSDGTAAWLASAADRDPRLEIVRLGANTGGAGGFAVGIERALAGDPDLVWLLDDDTVPEPGAARALVDAWREHPGERPAVLASRVVWTDGRDHPMNTPRPKPGAGAGERAAAAAVGAVPIRSASFVSIMCDAERIRERGLPVAAYFLWNDDFEYSTRLIRDGVGLYCPSSVVVHKTAAFGGADADPGDRFFYEVRNKVWVFARSQSLAPGEKVLYAGSTARRWTRTIAGSGDRRRLLRAARAGLRAGLAKPPDNGEVLAEARPPRVAAGGETPFTLLMSTYARDEPAYLREAFWSSTAAQTRPPAEVVLVRDGPLPAALAEEIDQLAAASEIPVRQIALAENLGLGPALDAGIAAATYEVIARMDADDVSAPERFERQLPLIEAGADIVGSGLLEFGETIDEVVGTRTPPSDPEVIREVIRFRDPFNHPTVVYRRAAVLAAGGYTDMELMEDYLLFARMVTGGAVPANIGDPLVYYRVGAGAYARRGGVTLLRSELALQRRFRRLGITSRGQYLRNVAVRGVYRLAPEPVRRFGYRRLLANRTGAPTGSAPLE